jgi:NitT/TauT family transport system permease protein
MGSRSRLYRLGIYAGRVLFGVGVLLLWEHSPELLGSSEFWLSRPSVIWASGVELLVNGTLLSDIGITLAETLTGLALGCMVGIPIGIALGRSRFLQDLLEPFLLVLNALPKIALAPLLLVWFGVGFALKAAIAFSLVVVVMILSTYLGMRALRQELINSCRTMGASEGQLLVKIVLPSIAPWLFAGLRVSIGFALIGAILGEFIAAQGGIGYLIDNAVGTFDTPVVFVGLLVLLALSWLINVGTDQLRRLVAYDVDSSDVRMT